MTDQEKAASIERANAYRQMFEMWAWKDFKKKMDDVRQSALEKTIWSSTMEEVQECRGAVKAIDSLLSDIDLTVSGI